MTYTPYSVRFKPDERAMLKEVARVAARKEADVIRVLVRSAYQALQQNQPTSAPTAGQEGREIPNQ
jgi:hypothetical protein